MDPSDLPPRKDASDDPLFVVAEEAEREDPLTVFQQLELDRERVEVAREREGLERERERQRQEQERQRQELEREKELVKRREDAVRHDEQRLFPLREVDVMQQRLELSERERAWLAKERIDALSDEKLFDLLERKCQLKEAVWFVKCRNSVPCKDHVKGGKLWAVFPVDPVKRHGVVFVVHMREDGADVRREVAFKTMLQPGNSVGFLGLLLAKEDGGERFLLVETRRISRTLARNAAWLKKKKADKGKEEEDEEEEEEEEEEDAAVVEEGPAKRPRDEPEEEEENEAARDKRLRAVEDFNLVVKDVEAVLRWAADRLRQNGDLTEAEVQELLNMLRDYRGFGDIAYWTAQLDMDEELKPGSVVALVATAAYGPRATRKHASSEKIIAWSIVAGMKGGGQPYAKPNPGKVDRKSAILLTYMGHVRVLVEGEVAAGDSLFGNVSSGRASRVNEENKDRRVGVALTAACVGADGEMFVDALVWLMNGSDPRLMELPRQITELSAQLQGYATRVEVTVEEVKQVRERMNVLEGQFSAMKKQMEVISASNNVVTEEDLRNIIDQCRAFCGAADVTRYAAAAAGSEERATVETRKCDMRLDCIIAWKARLVQLLPLSLSSTSEQTRIATLEGLAEAALWAERDVQLWRETVVMRSVKERCKVAYAEYELELFENPNGHAARLPFEEVVLDRRLSLVVHGDSTTDGKGKQLRETRRTVKRLDELLLTGKRTKLIAKAGMGKSTLCRLMCHRWAMGGGQDEAWASDWDVVVLITSVDVMLAIERRSVVERRSMEWVDVVADAWFHGKVEDAALFLAWCRRRETNSRILWICDGYDEIQGSLAAECPLLKGLFLGGGGESDLIFRSAIVTTRPEIDREIKFDQCVELRELRDGNVVSFIQSYFGCTKKYLVAGAVLSDGYWLMRFVEGGLSAAERKLFEILAESTLLQKGVRTPLILELLCYAVSIREGRDDDGVGVGQWKTCDVYRVVVDILVEKVVKKDANVDPKDKKAVLEAKNGIRSGLGEIAFKSLNTRRRNKNAAPESSETDVRVVVEDEDPFWYGIRRCGLLYQNGNVRNSQYFWKHLSFRDYLAAEWIFWNLKKMDKLAEVLRRCKGLFHKRPVVIDPREPFVLPLADDDEGDDGSDSKQDDQPHEELTKKQQQQQEMEKAALDRDYPFPEVATEDLVINLVCLIAESALQSKRGRIRMVPVVTEILGANFMSDCHECMVAIVRCVCRKTVLRELAKVVWSVVDVGSYWIEYVAAVGDKLMLEFLLDALGVRVEEAAVLFVAGTNGHLDVVEWLIDEKGMDPDLCFGVKHFSSGIVVGTGEEVNGDGLDKVDGSSSCSSFKERSSVAGFGATRCLREIDLNLPDHVNFVELLLKRKADVTDLFIMFVRRSKLELVNRALGTFKIGMDSIVEAVKYCLESAHDQESAEGDMIEALLKGLMKCPWHGSELALLKKGFEWAVWTNRSALADALKSAIELEQGEEEANRRLRVDKTFSGL
jgi:hypothetical protein